jgi:hypothetical protein
MASIIDDLEKNKVDLLFNPIFLEVNLTFTPNTVEIAVKKLIPVIK